MTMEAAHALTNQRPDVIKMRLFWKGMTGLNEQIDKAQAFSGEQKLQNNSEVTKKLVIMQIQNIPTRLQNVQKQDQANN
ncbi:unnamed protein product [Allacma fusca]|uniref:Uncharacterized protein n=1 Tax=Allacma fusca TaxID=39272 RepID=A0A8J2L9Q8_9HEXA|nr:unnamed protein product [Allacma fusca]